MSNENYTNETIEEAFKFIKNSPSDKNIEKILKNIIDSIENEGIENSEHDAVLMNTSDLPSKDVDEYILVFGREPNSYEGKYNYSSIGKIEMGLRDISPFHRTAIDKIKNKINGDYKFIFTNAFPKPIANFNDCKSFIRESLSLNCYKEHIYKVFDLLAYEGFLKNTKIIVLSGIEEKVGFPVSNIIYWIQNILGCDKNGNYKSVVLPNCAEQTIQDVMKLKKIPIIKIPFCCSWNSKKIDEVLKTI